MRSTVPAALSLVLLAHAGILGGCGSNGIAWTTWYSGACDARFDMPGRPASTFEATPQALGQQTFSMHREDVASPRFVYSCRSFSPGHIELIGPAALAEDLIRHEMRGFDATWRAGEILDRGESSRGVTLTRADGARADIRAVAVPGLAQAHATLTVGVAVELARRFVEAIEIQPKPKPGPMRIRSAECLASIVMPGPPEGTYVPPVVTHVLKDATSARLYVLRCVDMDDMLRKRTPGEIFQQSLVETTASGQWKAGEHTDFELDGRYAREQRYVANDGTRILHVRVAVDGARLQIASFEGKAGDETTAAGFLKSYRLHGPR